MQTKVFNRRSCLRLSLISLRDSFLLHITKPNIFQIFSEIYPLRHLRDSNRLPNKGKLYSSRDSKLFFHICKNEFPRLQDQFFPIASRIINLGEKFPLWNFHPLLPPTFAALQLIQTATSKRWRTRYACVKVPPFPQRRASGENNDDNNNNNDKTSRARRPDWRM